MIAERIGDKPRQIPTERFFLGPNRTVLKKDEVIREIVFEKPGRNARMAYAKLGLRNSMAISVVSLAVLIETEKGICRDVRIGLGAVAPRPMRALGAELNADALVFLKRWKDSVRHPLKLACTPPSTRHAGMSMPLCTLTRCTPVP